MFLRYGIPKNWYATAAHAMGNNLIPKLCNMLSVIVIINTYSIAALAPYYTLVAYFSIVQIISQLGVPAQYQREKLVGTDKLKVNKILSELDIYSGGMILFLLAFLFFQSDILEGNMYILGLVAILPASRVALFNSVFMKLKYHKKLFFLNSFVSSCLLLCLLVIYLINLAGFSIDPEIIASFYFIFPIVLKYALFHFYVGRYVGLMPLKHRLSYLRPVKRRKLWEIRLADVIRTFVGSSTGSLILILASSKLGPSEFALLGLLSSWANRTYLIFVSSVKQIVYPIFVELRNNPSKASLYASLNYYGNLGAGLLFCAISYVSTMLFFPELKFSLTVYFFFALLNYSISPFNDRLKSFGAFGILFKLCLLQGCLALLVFACVEFIFSFPPNLNMFVLVLLVLGAINHVTVLLFYHHYKPIFFRSEK